MTLRRFSIGLAAAVVLGLSPAWAQERGRPADSPTTGSAVPRGSSDSGSTSSSSSSNSGSSNSGSSGSSSPSSSGSWMDNQSQRYEAPRAPVHPSRFDAADFWRSAAEQRLDFFRTSGPAERVRWQFGWQPEREQLEIRIGWIAIWRPQQRRRTDIQSTARRQKRDRKSGAPHRARPGR